MNTVEIERVMRFKEAMESLDNDIIDAEQGNLLTEALVLELERASLNLTMMRRFGVAVHPTKKNVIGYDMGDHAAIAEMTFLLQNVLDKAHVSLLDNVLKG